MALINEKHKYIFFHLIKTGGNAARTILNSPECREIGSAHSCTRDIKKAMYDYPAKNKEGKFQKELFDNFFKFVIVRNSYDWLLSIYLHVFNSKKNKYYGSVSKLSFKEFITYYAEVMINEKLPTGANKCTSIKGFIFDDKERLLVNYVGRFEEMDKSFAHIQKRVGLSIRSIPFINVNKKKVGDYKKYYNTTTRRLVEKHFQQDLEYFKYKF